MIIMLSTIILSLSLAFLAAAQAISRARCRSIACVRSVDPPPNPKSDSSPAPERVGDYSQRPTIRSIRSMSLGLEDSI